MSKAIALDDFCDCHRYSNFYPIVCSQECYYKHAEIYHSSIDVI